MHVLVTGAQGYIGAQIVKNLLEEGHQVTGLINKNSKTYGYDPVAHNNPTYEKADLSQGLHLPISIEAIIHTAGRSPSKDVKIDDYIRDNVIATRNLISYARTAKVKKFINLSTISVYGQVTNQIVDEETPIVNPCDYGLSKRVCELLINSNENNFTSVSLRLPAIIGKSSSSNWLSNMLKMAKEGRDIIISNEMSYFNNALHIEDLNLFLLKLLIQKDYINDVYTLASNNAITIKKVAEKIVSTFGNRSSIRYIESVKKSFVISSIRAEADCLFRPMDVQDALHKFLEENSN